MLSDVGKAFPDVPFEACVGGVEAGVVNPDKGGDLRELGLQVLKDEVNGGGVVFVDKEDEHEFAGAFAGAHEDVAQVAVVHANVVVGDVVGLGDGADLVADVVDDGPVEVTGKDVDDLVEEFLDVESECSVPVDGLAFADDVAGHPMSVGECELDFVAVVVGLLTPYNGTGLADLEVADALKGVADLLLLEVELTGVVEALPLAAAAVSKVLADGLDTEGAGGDHAKDLSDGDFFLLADDAGIDDVSGDGLFDKDHLAVFFADAHATGGGVDDLNALDDLLGFVFCHLWVQR